jgi:membrane protease YdiL (CAAX protease family)
MSSFVKKYPAISLFILSLALSMAVMGPIMAGLLSADLALIAAFGPGVAGVILAAVEGRKGGVRELLRRGLIWRVGIGWYIFAFLSPLVVSVGALYIASLFDGPPVDLRGLPVWSGLPYFLITFIQAGIGEEFGWRGFAMPRLQARYSALLSSIIIGALWGLWHAPLMLIEGMFPYTEYPKLFGGFIPAVIGFSVYLIAWSIQHTWILNNTRGSVLLMAILHGALVPGQVLIDFFREREALGSTERWLGGIVPFLLLNVVVALVIVVLAGPENLSRKHERNVLAPEEG